MFNFLGDHRSSLFVAIGAAPGAILRMQISKKIFIHTKSDLYGVLLVNSIATFLLGILLGLQQKTYFLLDNEPLYLLLSIGLLGSFSTFSSLIFEFHHYYLNHRWMDLSLSLFVSIFIGIIMALFGFYCVNA
ncbi:MULTISPECIES: FluC/FEX family fluoride channel [unclassified Prochlorococcus]|uniref:FluC/FEX family fluoride channel n=1 Tax=unclassified Prochlorococcus TaxID=2627481 RepID=UPI00053383F2|nr:MULTISPECIES: CrcB family protein [unclassified Prochlorococcus]KGG14591.1 Integral membrane protein possibly involved in chromosome condensation [Prochlorococcus sp. MIT 0602]KGG15982.1 Integral membrane protein possibly involved in chromosome condensation [Prochlorococcus sp. MIT 0603]